MNLLDASAVLAFLLREPGHDVVRAQLQTETRCSAVNWAEVAQKVTAAGRSWHLQRAALISLDVVVEPVTETDADRAASLWAPRTGLSLADRLCLATAERLDATVWTADTAWGSAGRVRQIR